MPVDVGNNQMMKDCLSHYHYSVENFDTFNFRQAASCFHAKKVTMYIRETAELNEFLKDHPHYRYPGVALPNGVIGQLDKCWGQNTSYTTRGGC